MAEFRIKHNQFNHKIYSDLQILNRLNKQVCLDKQHNLRELLYLEILRLKPNNLLAVYFKHNNRTNNHLKDYSDRLPIREACLEANRLSSHNPSLFSDQAWFRTNKINHLYLVSTNKMITLRDYNLNNNKLSSSSQLIYSKINLAKINRLVNHKYLIYKTEQALVWCSTFQFKVPNLVNWPRLFYIEK